MLGFVAVFLVGIIVSDPLLFPTLPELQARALYWLISVALYLLLLPHWLTFVYGLWSRYSDRPIPHMLATWPFIVPQVVLGVYVWSALGYHDLSNTDRMISTVIKNTLLAFAVENGAALFLLPSFRESERLKDLAKGGLPVESARAAPAEPAPEPHFVVLNGRSVPVNMIRTARSVEHYLLLSTPGRQIELRARMKDFLEQLNDEHGIQTHRSHWVSASEAQELVGSEVTTVSGDRIPVSRGRLPAVRDWFEQNGKLH